MTDGELLDLLGDAAAAVRAALDTADDWGPSHRKAGQYAFDVVADEAALAVLDKAPELGVLSEESGLHRPDRDVWIALDPVDGSTNASRRIPWYATSLCVVDPDGPLVALVVNQATGDRFEAVRGEGATLNGEPIHPTGCARIAEAVVGITWVPSKSIGSRQIRAFGAAALDICAVAFGGLDAYIDFSSSGHSPWDYLGGILVCQEAGASVGEATGRDLAVKSGRRTIIAAATSSLLDEAVALRASAWWVPGRSAASSASDPQGSRLQQLAFRTWRRLPSWVRLFVVRRATPSYHVGAICVIERADGALLLIRNSYRQGWGFPGGFLKRGESAEDAARREIQEEIGVDVKLDPNPKVVVEAGLRRVDVIFSARPVVDGASEDPRPRSAEILEARWFPATDLPDLQTEAARALVELGRANLPR